MSADAQVLYSDFIIHIYSERRMFLYVLIFSFSSRWSGLIGVWCCVWFIWSFVNTRMVQVTQFSSMRHRWDMAHDRVRRKKSHGFRYSPIGFRPHVEINQIWIGYRSICASRVSSQIGYSPVNAIPTQGRLKITRGPWATALR